jgi:TolA-binding protein
MRIYLYLILLFCGFWSSSQTIDERLAIQFYESNEFEKAESLFKKLYKQRSRSALVYEYYLNTLIALKKGKDAERLVETHLKKTPENIGLRVDLGMVYDRFNKNEKAKNYFNKTIKSTSSSIYEIKSLANGFRRRGYLDEAIKVYDVGIKKYGTSTFYIDLIYTYRIGLKTKELANFSIHLITEDPEKYSYVVQNLNVVFDDSLSTSYLQNKTLSYLQKKPNSVVLSLLFVECCVQQKQFNLALRQIISVDRLEAAGGKRVLGFAHLCVQNKAFTVAEDAFSYVVNLGESNLYYIDGQSGLINTLFVQTTLDINPNKEKINELTTKIQKFIDQEGVSYKTAQSIFRLAEINVFYLDKTAVAVALLLKLLKTPRLKGSFVAKTKLLIGDCYLMLNNIWDARLMYGQVEKQFKEDALGQEARFKSAQLSYYIGDFDWAKNQLDILKTATTQLISNNALELSLLIQDNTGLDSTDNAMKEYASVEFLLYQNKISKCKETLNLLPFKYPNHSLNDEILYLKAQVQEKLGNYVAANQIYESVYKNYSTDLLADNALYRSAMINLQVLKNKAVAVQLFEKIILEYSSSLYVSRARDFYYQLKRGA